MFAERHRVDGNLQESVDAYKRAAKIARDSRTVQYNIGLMLMRLNQIESAELHAKNAIKLDPFRPHPYKLLAKILEKKGNIEGARELYRSAALQSL
jgi:Flp pilus assembly protein TadD